MTHNTKQFNINELIEANSKHYVTYEMGFACKSHVNTGRTVFGFFV
jgi:hypothetical protein